MNVLIDARPLQEQQPGGVTRVAEFLLPELIRTFPTATVVTAGWKKSDQHHHIRLPNKFLSGLFWPQLTSIDQLVPNHDLLFLFNIGFVGRPRIPYTLIVHDMSFLIEPKWYSFKSRMWHNLVQATRLIKNASHLFAVSETTKQDLIKMLDIPADRITTISLGPTACPTPAPLPNWLRDVPFLFAMDASNVRKNIQVTIDAFRILKKNPAHKHLKLILTGANASQSHPDIIALHRPNHAEIAMFMQYAQTFLYPSWYEGFGLPLHEAASFETPCIASTTSCLPETAPKNTLFAPPTRPQLWADAIEMILKNPMNWKTKSSLPSWENIAKKITDKLIVIFK